MKLKNKETQEIINNLYIFLTPKEAKELSFNFKKLLNDPGKYVINMKGEDIKGSLSKEIVIIIS